MIEKIIQALNIKVTYTEKSYITITSKRRAKGAFRWNYFDNQGEILLAKSSTERTKLHEIGHAINFILGRGSKVSDMIGIESEEFANIMADTLEKLAKK
ncbi:MAG: hypothetical protein EOM23_01130 [Candidatus Moranbacteria bacterium]|nr:hypothetical protein [Candidatus Moranbacteria bacterium]